MISNLKNRQYDEMLAAAVKRMAGLDFRTAAEKAGLDYDASNGSAIIRTLGRISRLNPANCSLTPPLDMWHHLSILQYLEAVDGSLPSDRWIGMGELAEGGMVRGASFDREIDSLIASRLGCFTPGQIENACAELGGVLQGECRADLCAVFAFMPRFPLRLQLWFADDEFPASGKVLINDGVKHCLGTEAIGTVATLLIQQLCTACEKTVEQDQ